MKSSRWYFAANGNGYGPFTYQQLKQLAQTEMIGPSDFVWQQGDTETRHVNDVDGLFHDPVPPHTSLARRAIWCGTTALLILLIGGGAWLMFRRDWSTESGSMAKANSLPAESQPTQDAVDDEQVSLDADSVEGSEPEGPEPKREPESSEFVEASSAPQQSSERETNSTVGQPAETIAGEVASGNVALANRGATATGPYRKAELLLDGKPTAKDNYAKTLLNVPVVITFPKVYQLRTVRINLIAAWLPNNSKESFYRYKVEVSEDGTNYEMVANRTTGRHRDWQDISFVSRPVKSIRITGTHDHPHNSGIRIAEVQAFCAATSTRTLVGGQQKRNQAAGGKTPRDKISERERRRKMTEKRILDAFPKKRDEVRQQQ